MSTLFKCIAIAIALFYVILGPALVSAQTSSPDLSLSKSVDNPVPVAPQQTIEFTIERRNIGNATALDVVAKDQLPAGLEIPEGMAAFTSHGDFDAATGTWNVG